MKAIRIKYLLEQYNKNALTEKEKEELDQWYKSFDEKEDDIHLVHLRQEKDSKTGETIYRRVLSEIDHKKQKFLLLRWAAVIAVLVTASVVLYVKRVDILREVVAATNKTITAPDGKMIILDMPDGSKAWIRSGSTLTYNKFFLGSERNIQLKGEAFFEVEKNPNKPFVVYSGSLKTAVLGTSFNVKALPELNVYGVMVRTGKVQVSDSTGILANLSPSDRLVIKNKKKLRIDNTNIDSYLSWREGSLLFENSSMEEIKWYLENLYGVRLEFENEKMKNCSFSGDFTGLPLQQILKIMQEVHPFEITYVNNRHLKIRGMRSCGDQ